MAKGNDDTHAEADRRDAFERAWDYSHEAGGTDEPDESDGEGSRPADLAQMRIRGGDGRDVEP